MDFNQTVQDMLAYFGEDPSEHLNALLMALGSGIAAASVVCVTSAQQNELLDFLFEDIKADAAERYASYEAFLAMDKAKRMRMH